MPNIIQIPASQIGKRLCFAFLTFSDLRPILLVIAVGLAGKRMSDNVAALEVLSLSCFLKYQVLRKVIAVVADVQTCDEYILSLRHDRARCGCDTPVRLNPEDTELAKLLRA